MSVRRRILLATLALGVVGTLVVLIWTSGPKDATPKLSFVLVGYTNNVGRCGIVRVTNCGTSAVCLTAMGMAFENEFTVKYPFHFPWPMVLKAGESTTGGFTIETNPRWRACYWVKRDSWSNRFRPRLQKLPLIGSRIELYDEYKITSDWFTQ